MSSIRLLKTTFCLLTVLLMGGWATIETAAAQNAATDTQVGGNEVLAAASWRNATGGSADATETAPQQDFFALKASIVDLSTGAISNLQSVPSGSSLDVDPGLLFEPGDVEVRSNGLSITGTGTGVINHPDVAAEPLEVRYSTDFTIGRQPFRVVTGTARFMNGTEEVAHLDRDGLHVPQTETPPPVIATAQCDMSLPTDQAPIGLDASALEDRTVSLGGFPLTITTADGSAGQLNGTGRIDVPYMEAPLAVTFSGLAINAANEVYAGTATATQDAQAGEIQSDLLSNYDQSTAEELAASHIADIYGAIEQGRRADQLGGADPVGLPYGVVPAGGKSANLTIAVAGVRFTPTGTRAKTLLQIPIPSQQSSLPMSADDVCVDADGFGGSFAMRLGSDVEIGNPDLTVQRFKKQTASAEGTRMTWENGDFGQLHVELETVFPRDWLIPLDAQDQAMSGRAVATFSFTRTPAEGVTDWVAEGTLQRSELAAASGFVVPETSVYFDNSTVRNADGMTFPDGYQGITGTLWTGLYAAELPLQLPEAVRTIANPSARIEAPTTGSFIVDRQGVSVKAGAQDLIAYGEGDLGGWGYGIDDFALEITKNSLIEGAMTGGIRLPLFREGLPYNATIVENQGGDLDYSFLLGSAEGGVYHSDLWQSQILVKEGTNISVDYSGGEFTAEATIHGDLGLIGETPEVDVRVPEQTLSTPGIDYDVAGQNVGVGAQSITLPEQGFTIAGQTVKLATIPFEGLTLRTDGPTYVEAGVWSKAESDLDYNQIGGFPIKVKNVTVVDSVGADGNLDLGLQFQEVGLFLPGMEQTQTFTASTSFTLWSTIERPQPGSVPVARYDGGQVDIVKLIGGVGKAFHLDGQVIFFNKGTEFGREFGSGLAGSVNATVMRMVNANVDFVLGEKDGTDFWFFQAGVFSQKGLTIPASELIGRINVHGFRGGAYYHMKPPLEWVDRPINYLPDDPPRFTGDPFPGPDPGDTGINFEVDPSVAAGLRAGFTLSYGSPQVFNGDLNADLAFNATTGLEQITLNGKGFFLSKGRMRNNITEREASAQGIADVSLAFNVPETTFHGVFSAIIQPYGGLTQAQGKATLHLNGKEDKYFFQIGDPAENWFQIPTGGGFAKGEMFLYAGNGPPAHVKPVDAYCNASEFTYDGTSPLCDPNYAPNPPNSDQGYLLGLGVSAGFGGQVGPFYGALDAGMGASLGLQSVGAATCKDSGEQPGFNGYYARGQFFAGVYGEVGVEINLAVYRGRFDIAQVGLVTELEGGFPNPSWVRGSVSGRYRVLNGLAEGDFTYDFGQAECELTAGQAIAGLDAIQDVSPKTQESSVSVFQQPSATFSLDLDKEHTILDSNGNEAVVRMSSDGITLYEGGSTSGSVVPGTVEKKEDGALLVFSPSTPLKGQTTYTFTVNAYAEEKSSSGSWVGATDENGNAVPHATRTVTFTTGRRPRTIQDQHVKQTRPRDRKPYYVEGMHNTNGIYFKGSNFDYSYLRNMTQAEKDDPNVYGVYFRVKYKSLDGRWSSSSPWVNWNDSSITWGQPNLDPSTLYVVQLVRKQRMSVSVWWERFLENLRVENQRRTIDASGNAVQVRERKIKGTTTIVPGEKVVYSYHFRTSAHPNLASKMRGAEANRFNSWWTSGWRMWVQTNEPFDTYDIEGAGGVGPLVHFTPSNPYDPYPSSKGYNSDYVEPYVHDVNMPFWYDVASGFRKAYQGKSLLYATSVRGGGFNDTHVPLRDEELISGQFSRSTSMGGTTFFKYPFPEYAVHEHRSMKAYMKGMASARKARHIVSTLNLWILFNFKYGIEWPFSNVQRVMDRSLHSYIYNDARRRSYLQPYSYTKGSGQWIKVYSPTDSAFFYPRFLYE